MMSNPRHIHMLLPKMDPCLVTMIQVKISPGHTIRYSLVSHFFRKPRRESQCHRIPWSGVMVSYLSFIFTDTKHRVPVPGTKHMSIP